jgi:Carbohydrate-selective porin, OprB family/S-layer homology domain
MSRTFWNAIKLSPAVLGAAILVAGAAAIAAETPESKIGSEATTAASLGSSTLALSADATTGSSANVNNLGANNTQLAQATPATQAQPAPTLDQINQYVEQGQDMGQVTSVSQLTDVDPTHWAFQALQSLVERYGCIEGYPDRTYRGNRALTRYEFAAGLNACLDRIQELIAAAVADLPSKEDIATIRRLQEEFAAELATLRGRVDALEARTARLEAQQFSTTTKLSGEVIFALAGAFGDDKAVPSPGSPRDNDVEDNIIMADRVRLNFDTSFSGKDLLRTRLQARNITPFATAITGTNMTRLGFDGNENNDIEIDDLYYRFPIASRASIYLAAARTDFNDMVNVVNPFMDSSGSGAISRFGRFNPIYRQGNEGAGVGLNAELTSAIGINAAYLATFANDPDDNDGLFNGQYSAIGQLVLFPRGNFKMGLTYVRSYFPGSTGGANAVNLTGSTGSGYAANPFGSTAASGIATSSNSYGIEASWRLSKNFAIGGWAGLTEAEAESGRFRGANATIFNWAANLALPDLGKKGNLLGFVVGQPPKVTENDLDGGSFNGSPVPNREDDDTSWHLEGFYRLQVTPNIQVTPGVFVIINPEHNDNNGTIYVGTIRTRFSF